MEASTYITYQKWTRKQTQVVEEWDKYNCLYFGVSWRILRLCESDHAHPKPTQLGYSLVLEA